MPRFFLVMYSAIDYNGGEIKGVWTIEKEDGEYLNMKTTMKTITEGIEGRGRSGIKHFLISNIIELSEKDYNTWVK